MRRFPRSKHLTRHPAWLTAPLALVVVVSFLSFALAFPWTAFLLSLVALAALVFSHGRRNARRLLRWRGSEPVYAALFCALISGGVLGCQALQPAAEEAAPESSQYDAAVTVARAVDGDTVEITPAVDGIDRVRLIGIDAPETNHPQCGEQPYGAEAAAYAADQLAGERVDLEFDVERTDRYGRLLAYVHLETGEMFNETLLEEGYAQAATFPPNTRYESLFELRQQEARSAERGLWGLPEEELAQQTDRGNGIGEC
jgi:micrococcal nuclease